MPAVHTIETRAHGRYLVEPPAGGGPWPWLVGFHGQGETAAIQLEALSRMRPGPEWGLVSVQGLHRYYARTGDVVAAWMTREDRELAIADNIAYVAAVVAAVGAAHGPPSALVYSGFSQGVAMAYRAAAAAGHPCAGIVVLGGDVPPDVAPAAAALPPVLLGRGAADPLYPAARAERDLAVLRDAGATVELCEFDAAHAYGPAFDERARTFLADVAAGRPPVRPVS
ncbi:MAG: alpha/beta hydrolase [Vicinamibacterales bacterium]